VIVMVWAFCFPVLVIMFLGVMFLGGFVGGPVDEGGDWPD